MAAITDMQLLVMTITAADCRPVRDRLCYITMPLHFLRDEPGPQTFHPLRVLHLSWRGDKQRLPGKQLSVLSPGPGAAFPANCSQEMQ